MKRLIAILLVLLLSIGCAIAEIVPYEMRVTNCDEWVSLRESPSTKADRIVKVPLDSTVTDCYKAKNGFIECEYKGIRGYILAEYLEAVSSGNTFSDIEDLPEYNRFMVVGKEVLEETLNGYTIAVRSGMDGDYENICAVCYDANLNPIWSVMHTATVPLTELRAIDAFIVGTEDAPELAIYVSGDTMTGYGIGKWTDVLWEADVSEVGGGVTHAVYHDGKILLIGFYNDTLYCYGNDGTLLWSASANDTDLYWPYEIMIVEGIITVYYDGGEGGTARFDMQGNQID